MLRNNRKMVGGGVRGKREVEERGGVRGKREVEERGRSKGEEGSGRKGEE